MTSIWTTKTIDLLLQSPSSIEPDSELYQEIERFGGLSHIYHLFKGLALNPLHQDMLNIILDSPYSSPNVYAKELAIHRATYYRQYRKLLEILVDAFQRGLLSKPIHTKPIKWENPYQLPLINTATIGREQELQHLKHLLSDHAIRLITFIGAGGIGKTRLAQQVAWDNTALFEDGVVWIDLASYSNSILTALVASLNINAPTTESIKSVVYSWIKYRRLLIIFDTFEHMIEEAAFIQELLHQAPYITILITSQLALQIYGEHRYPIQALSLSEPAEQPAAHALFIRHAQHHGIHISNDKTPYIETICQELEGMPLAIELVATHISSLPIEIMAQHIASPEKLSLAISKTKHGRHQSLETTLQWSLNLLPQQIQTFFYYLGIFRGSWLAEDALALHPTQQQHITYMLRILIDHQLVELQPEYPPRYRLIEPIRAFAASKLHQAAYRIDITQRYINHMSQKAIELYSQRFKQSNLVAEYKAIYSNSIHALEQSYNLTEYTQSITLFEALFPYWRVTATMREAKTWVTKLETILEHVPLEFQARYWHAVGIFYSTLTEHSLAETMFKRALNLYQPLHNYAKIGILLSNIGVEKFQQRQYEASEAMYRKSIAYYESWIEIRSAEMAQGYATVLSHLGIVLGYQQRFTEGLDMTRLAYDINMFHKHPVLLQQRYQVQIYNQMQEFNKALQLLDRINHDAENRSSVLELQYFYSRYGLADYTKALYHLEWLYNYVMMYDFHNKQAHIIACYALLLFSIQQYEPAVITFGMCEKLINSGIETLNDRPSLFYLTYRTLQEQLDQSKWEQYYNHGQLLQFPEWRHIILRYLTPLLADLDR